MTIRIIFTGVAMLALAACNSGADNAAVTGAPVAEVAPPAGTQWATIVAATPDGGFVMGNPNAPIKLVEYGSLSCSHCADFSEAASEALRTKYVASGKVSYEFRSYLLGGQDVFTVPSMQAKLEAQIRRRNPRQKQAAEQT